MDKQTNYLYHGSKKSFPKLRRRKAQAPPGRPPEEAMNAIYLTPDFFFAYACAARPPGITNIDFINRTICFQNPEQFNPDEIVYIYYVDPKKIAEDKKIQIDRWQIAVTEHEITPDKVKTYKSGDIFKHYRLIENDKFNFFDENNSE